MTTEITPERMTAQNSRHYAEQTPDGWIVSWLPGRPLSRNQATTAMVLAEHVASGIDGPGDRRWVFIEGWAAELGLSGADAVGKISYYGGELVLAAPANSAGCFCPEDGGAIRHLSNTCPGQAAEHRRGFLVDTGDIPAMGIKVESAAGEGSIVAGATADPSPRLSIAERGRYEWERALMNSRTMMPIARLVALVISLWTGPDGCQGVWLSYTDISRFTGLSPYMTRRWLQTVEQEGWIRRETVLPSDGPRPSHHIYYLSFPRA